MYAHQRATLFAEDRLDDLLAASRRHPGGFEFGGVRFRVVSEEDALTLRDAYTIVAPGGGRTHIQRLPAARTASTPSPGGSKREMAASAAERRARAWEERCSKRAKR